MPAKETVKIKNLKEKSVGWLIGQIALWIFFWPIMLILLICGLYWKWGM